MELTNGINYLRLYVCGMESNVLVGEPEETLRGVFDSTTGALYVVNPWVGLLDALAETGREYEDPPTIRVIAREDTLRTARNRFTLGSRLSDLVGAGVVSLRESSSVPETTVLVDDETVYSPVVVGDRAGAFTETGDAFVAGAVEGTEALWESAEAFDLRTPARATVRETLTAEFDGTVREDFETVVESIEGGRATRELDEVIVSLLVAAKHELLLYDVSRWGEDVGLASKATFSRRKTDLEEMGVVETEKSPTDVGRPRQRLRLTDERFQEADGDSLAALAQNVLY